MLNGHGDDRYLFGKEITADFSSNVYYDGVSDGLKKQLAASLEKVNNYPEANAQSLQKSLAAWHGIDPEQVLVTNGATEAFYLIAHAYRNKSATIIIPAFAEYEDACSANDIAIQYLLWADVSATTVFNTDLVFFGNPNNPTGAIFPKGMIKEMLAGNPATVFVIDEAYIDFTRERASMVESIGKNLIIVKSLTKTYSIPGLRLGYLLSDIAIIQKILKYKMPWSVNALAIEAGIYITQHREALPLEILLQDTAELIKQLRQIDGITVLDSHTNFLLCRTNKGTAAALKLFLLDTYGILIRDAANFRSLSPAHFRVATQTSDKNALLVKGISTWMNS
ncbi:threonine-phosphate decarboxylase [Chitinophaga sp. CF118]|uniref:pyridoxal phosphate-dependent aminotransferase n=1 Tax=Chitinophaga sp. CF118 TaxID=1884367 RepID=UPI0008E84AFF|nr:aminotransferase class I/II-fold pyridoxal phosphate-dependent enzyme [Chitinophaga sp. CF118]SFD48049.1 threonine-phosphate decarboxylase [Chitinophaga sp. CF118]